MEIYAVDPTGKSPPAQITASAPECTAVGSESELLPCGFVDPVPSPNSRYLLYHGTDNSLWLARADGRAPHEFQSTGQRADWSRDSRRVAYPAPDGIHVVRADGTDDRLIAPSLVGDVSWSSDGRGLVVHTSGDLLYEFRGGKTTLLLSASGGHARQILPSPNKRWLAIIGVGADARLVSLRAGRPAVVPLGQVVVGGAWARDSRHLAAVTPGGLRIYDLRTRSSRLTTRDTGYTYEAHFDWSPLGVAWAPDGRSIAYIRGSINPFDGGVTNGNLRITTPGGRARTLVSTEHAFGGRMLSVAWAQSPPGLHYRRGHPSVGRRVTPTSLLAPGPIFGLAADGGRVAFIACQGVYAWTPATGDVTTAEQMGLPSMCADRTNYAFYDVALAGDRLLYADSSGCNVISQRVRLKLLDRPVDPTTIASGRGACGGPYQPFVGDLAGGGDLLVFSRWDERVHYSTGPAGYSTTQQDVQRVEADGCPCPDVASSAGPLTPADVDDGRIVAFGEKATLVLDRDGRTLLSIPVAPTAAQLSGNDLVVLLPGELRDYDASSGASLHTWSLTGVPNGRVCWLRCLNVQLTLEDASHGLVAYVLDGEVHILRLADGADKVVASGRSPRFMDAGLVYADGDRVWIVPFAKLPLVGF
jgi:hypothetical protein